MGQNVIELNGKRYDAITGAYLGKSNVIPKHITESYVHGKVIDGFVRPTQTARRSAPPPKQPASKEVPKIAEVQPVAPQAVEPARTTPQKPVHATADHLKAHTPQRAQTLMHRAARKPKITPKPAIKVQAPAEIMAKPQSAIMRKRSAYGIDPSRQERAVLTNQHQAIRHFHPAHKPAAHHSVSVVSAIPVQPAPLTSLHRPKAATPHTDIFEKAIAHATSHQQPAHTPRKHRTVRRKFVNALAITAAFLVIGGFVGYLNMPQLELKFAAFQAGFGASMPAYSPTGYALEGGVKRSGGTISLRFRSGDSSYTVTQQSSNWNSQTLLDNTLALNGKHETVERNGQTIYVYDKGTSASWVNGGVRYDLNGNAQLSTDEIVSIATSL